MNNNTPSLPQLPGDVSKISVVSGKQLKCRAKIPKEERLKVIREFYGVKKLDELAAFAGVTVRTISNDIKEWRASGEEAEERRQRIAYYLKTNLISDSEKFRALVLLEAKSMTNNQNIRVDVDEQKADEKRVLEALKQYNFSTQAKEVSP